MFIEFIFLLLAEDPAKEPNGAGYFEKEFLLKSTCSPGLHKPPLGIFPKRALPHGYELARPFPFFLVDGS